MPELKDKSRGKGSGGSGVSGFDQLIGRYNKRFKFITDRLKADWHATDLDKQGRALQRWVGDFDWLLFNAHANSYAAGFRMTGGDPEPKQLSAVAHAVRDLESYFSRGFENDLDRGDKRYFDDDGTPKPDAIHGRMQMYLGRCRGTANGGWVDGCDVEERLWWRLGAPESGHCPDCPIFAEGGPYTKATLPTVPGGNDTPCLFRCTCHIEREADGSTSPKTPDLPSYDDTEAEEPPEVPKDEPNAEPVLISHGEEETEYVLPHPEPVSVQ